MHQFVDMYNYDAYAATTITVGDGKTAEFWHTPWLLGAKPRDIAPLIFEISKGKNLTVRDAMHELLWLRNINMASGLSVNHIMQFCALWSSLEQVQLQDGIADDIVWKFTANGKYSAVSAYKARFLGMVDSVMVPAVWGNWAPPNANFSLGLSSKTKFGWQIV